MSGKKPRSLRPDEQELWDRVASSAVPLVETPARALAKVFEQPKPKPAIKSVKKIMPFQIGQSQKTRTHVADLAPTPAESLGQQPVRMDSKAFKKMKQGKLRPEAKIDLHGMTLSRAHPRLQAFIMGAAAEGKRLVLVITGKGRDHDHDGPIPTRTGVLRHQVPQWLTMPPCHSVVLQVAPSHKSHGGEGAYYVYLRRLR